MILTVGREDVLGGIPVLVPLCATQFPHTECNGTEPVPAI